MEDSEKDMLVTRNEKRPVVIVEGLPKHMRRRYWSSWEEMKLVELWRRYYDDITTLLKNVPIFTSISTDMRSYGFQVNPQECRRKINNINNKYYAERRKLESSTDPDAESEWRLYPLVHCLLIQSGEKLNKCHERNTVKDLLAKLPPLPTGKPQPAPKQQSVLKQTAPGMQNNIDNNSKNNEENGFPKPIALSTTPYKRTYRTSSAITVTSTKFATLPTETGGTRVSPYTTAKNGINHRLLRQRITVSHIEELKKDNLRLTERRDIALKRLCIEEREVKMLENVVHTLQCGGD